MSVFKRFKSDQRGSVATIFGFAAIPLIGFVGAAVDYSRAANEMTKLQLAVDAVALSLLREPSTANVQARATTLIGSMFATKDHVTLGTPVIRRDGSRVTVELSATVRNAFMQVLGQNTVQIGARGEAVQTKAELALVLDNTGSMADDITGGRKIDALQSAAKTLLRDLRDVANQHDTMKVSIVPFDTEVRLDANTYRNKPWFRWKNPVTDREDWKGYVFDRYGSYALSDRAPDLTRPDTLFPVAVETEYKTEPVLKSLRTSGGRLAAVQPLTSLYGKSDFDRLNATIESMTPRGYTNVALGTIWGLTTLTRSEPFSEGAPSADPTVKKYMVILTDGDNNFYHLNGSLSNDETAVDKNTASTCTTVKDAGVEVFTIRLEKGDGKLLKACASSSKNYFNVQSKADLEAAFKRITDAITGARLTH
ncbi:pilus assembly protein TadG-related protein [uncultured Enterovirga sp.]|uniref:TadE/TadG family type IV pilus assembly protein n=1 Tax=uncultured Enterovirga sp. TaxID=2026352 RepID=UPI0035CC753F